MVGSFGSRVGVLGLKIFDELLDVAPDGISGYVGVDCPGVAEPFVEEVDESVEFRRVRCDFGRWERLEHVVDSLLDSEERFEDISWVP